MSCNIPTLTKASLFSILISAALVGCAVGPSYVAPQTKLGPFHSVAVGIGKSAQKPPLLEQWWVEFNDPMLVTIVQRALAENLDLAASVARVTQARAQASGAGAQMLPTADINASSMSIRQSLNSPTGIITSGSPDFKRNVHGTSIGTTASWEIDLFGGNRRNAAAWEYESQAAEADQAGTRVMVASDAADAYFQIRGYQARLAIVKKQIDADEQLLKLVKRRYDAGAAQGLEVAQADAVLKSARARVPPLRMALEQQLNRLDVVMGAQPGSYAQELQQAREIPDIPGVPDDAQPLDVLRRRPDIIAAERRLAASNERIGAAISNYYPKISLSAIVGFDKIGGRPLFTSNSVQGNGGGLLRWRLFDFGKIDAEVAQARGANAEALALYRKAVLRAAEDVENAFFGFTQSQIYVAQINDQVQALVKSRDLSERAYRAGSITLTDVLLANQQLLTARDQYEATRASATRAAVSVFRALGGGWDAAPSNNEQKN